MRAFFVLLLLILPAACANNFQTADNTPERAVEVSFLVYKSALQQKDGSSGSELLTTKSHEYYRRMADEALSADRSRLMELNVVDRIIVLLMRHGLSTEQLHRASGKELVAAAIYRGWFSQNSAASVQLTNFRVSGDQAVANLLRHNGDVSSVTMEFLREDDGWRLDLLHTLEEARKVMKLAIALSGKTEDDLVLESLREGTGREAGPEIWSPPS